jgi:hypothetical protein
METDGTKPDLENRKPPPWEVRAAWARGIVANIRPKPEIDRTVVGAYEHHVYWAYSAGRIKIGTSNNVPDRLRGLSGQSPHPVTIIMTRPGSIDLERKLHACLDSLRLHGEWFRLTTEFRKYLDQCLCRSGKRKLSRVEAEFRKWVQSEFLA